MTYMLLDTRTMILAQRNGLTVRLATSAPDIAAAQRLRFKVFYEELSARADAQANRTRRDADDIDSYCDHLLVVEDNAPDDDGTAVAGGRLVGTYRLLRQDVAEQKGGFYSQREFDVQSLLKRHPGLRFLEVGRSCVAPGFRGKPVAELLWQGIWNYVRVHKLDVMLGCASLPGTSVESLAEELTFLATARETPAPWRVGALPHLRLPMQQKPTTTLDPKSVLRRLPTLVKAYLRLGCYFGDGAVTDHQFNTTDVLIVLPVADINPRYFDHYGAPV